MPKEVLETEWFQDASDMNDELVEDCETPVHVSYKLHRQAYQNSEGIFHFDADIFNKYCK